MNVESSFRSGFAALVGRPNAGKSTLLNHLVGERIAAVSSKPQTTRTRILGILNRPKGQIVFADTPGIHKPGYALNRRMMGTVSEALNQVDVVVLVRDATSSLGSGDQFTLELIRNAAKPTILVLNKIDVLPDKRALLPLIDSYRREFDFAEIMPMSALTGDGCEVLIDAVISNLPEGEPLYDPDQYTDQAERTIVAEMVREQILEATGEEIPFASAVRVESWNEAPDATEIHCVIYVERESQKPIIIGRGGQRLKEVGTQARRAIENLLERHVRLHLFVRVQDRWRNDPQTLDLLGISEK